MDNGQLVFLTMSEAITAIKMDFTQYNPQKALFKELCPVLLGENAFAIEDAQSNTFWLKTGNSRKMQKLSGEELGSILCENLNNKPPSMDLLANICKRVFLTRAFPGHDKEANKEGIWIHRGMDGFSCRLCGQCCAILEYHNECTEKDYRMWQALGRDDILERVGIVKQGDRITAYQLWIEPFTGRLSKICPWLDTIGNNNKYGCKIHDVKPEICRSYPGTRKHAVMTGCRGFEKPVIA